MLLTRPNTLSDKQCRDLEEVKRTTQDVRVYRRAKVILYRNAGYTPDEILEHTDYSEREQRYVIRRYREEGIAGLFDRPKSGRPRLEKPEKVEQQAVEETGGVIRAHEPSSEPNREPEKPEKVEQQIVEETGGVIPAHEPSHEPNREPEKPKMEAKLDELARETLECMQRYHPKRYLRERAQMLLWRNDGYSAREIADMLGVSVTTVRQVFTTYDREKLAGVYRKPGSGRLSKLRTEQWEQFAKWAREGPKALGYRFVKWTTRSLRKYIFKRFNITLSREWIRQKLHEFIDYSWTRGKKVYAYPENETRNTERKIFAEKMLSYLKQACEGTCILLFEDESIFTLFGEVGYSWSPTGSTQEIPSAGKHGRVVVFGIANPLAGRLHYRIEDDSINQESTLRFLTQVVRYYQKHAPGMPLVIVLDKHPGHTAGSVDDFIKTHEHVTLENTPTQSPDLNPIERVWDWLSDLMIKNDFFETIDGLKHAIRHFFCYAAGIKERAIQCLGDLQKLYSAEAGVATKI